MTRPHENVGDELLRLYLGSAELCASEGCVPCERLAEEYRDELEARMTLFTPEMTIREKYEPAMTITDQAEADAYFEKCVVHSLSFGYRRDQAEEIERKNLGYFAGYYDHETRERVERLFRCEHPIFGSIAKNGPPTAEAALWAGVRRAKGI